jgi:hypothetical protein
MGWGGIILSPLGMSATTWPIVAARNEKYGAFGGISFGRGNRSTRRKPAPMPFCLPQIPHDLIWVRMWVVAAGSWRLTP